MFIYKSTVWIVLFLDYLLIIRRAVSRMVILLFIYEKAECDCLFKLATEC